MLDRRALIAPLFVFVLIAGCKAPAGVPVTGTLAVNGKAYVPPDKSQVSIRLIPDKSEKAEKAQQATAEADPTGAFTLQSATAKGVMPGKYKVVVTGVISGQYNKDLFNDSFTAENTPLSVDILPETKSITIDIGAKNVTKQ
jgi:hypothetical protein